MSLDLILTLIGIVLIAFGLYIFLAGKGSSKDGVPSNRLEGFGIKLDIANPSILLIILGVGLLLVPRFFPDATQGGLGEIAGEVLPQGVVDAVVAEAPATPAAPAEPEPPAAAAAPVTPPSPVTPPTPPSPPASQPEPEVAETPVPAEQPAEPAPEPPAERPSQPSSPSAPSRPAAASSVLAVRPELAARPVMALALSKPKLWVVVDAEVADRAGIRGLSAERYSRALRGRLLKVAQERFGRLNVSASGEQPSIRAGKWARVCRAAPEGVKKLLLAKQTIPADDFSNIESSFWPQLVMVGVNCEDGRVQRYPSKRLSPQRSDEVPFIGAFESVATEFVASRGYFLQSDN